MKRALVVLLALVLGAGLLFAADAKWGAWIEGDVVLYDSDGNAYVGPGWFGAPAGAGAYNTLSLSYSEDNFGFAMTSEFEADAFNSALRDIKGWYKLFDGMLKVSAGKLRIGDYRPTTYVEGTAAYGRILSAQWGLLLQVMPVEGLSIGVAAEYPNGRPGVANAADYANNLAFAASYDIAELAKLFVQYSLMTDTLGVAAEVKAVKGLPILVSFAYNTASSAITTFLSASYGMDKLSFALDAKIAYATAFDYGVEANVGYALSDMYKVGATVSYANAGGAFFTDLGAGFGVYPWFNVAVGGGSLNLGFALWTGDPAALGWKIPLKYVIAF
jgi:hypothetical protein